MNQFTSCSPFERMDQGDAHIGKLCVEPTKHLITWAFLIRDSQHPFLFSTELRLRPSRLRRPHSTFCTLRVATQVQMDATWTHEFSQDCARHPTPPRVALYSSAVQAPLRAPPTTRSAPSSKPTVRERRPIHWFSLGMKPLSGTDEPVFTLSSIHRTVGHRTELLLSHNDSPATLNELYRFYQHLRGFEL